MAGWDEDGDGVPPEEAVAFVRRRYHRHAVETPWQRRLIEQSVIG